MAKRETNKSKTRYELIFIVIFGFVLLFIVVRVFLLYLFDLYYLDPYYLDPYYCLEDSDCELSGCCGTYCVNKLHDGRMIGLCDVVCPLEIPRTCKCINGKCTTFFESDPEIVCNSICYYFISKYSLPIPDIFNLADRWYEFNCSNIMNCTENIQKHLIDAYENLKERFMLKYSFLSPEKRNGTAVVINGENITWERAYEEINSNSSLSKEILKKMAISYKLQ